MVEGDILIARTGASTGTNAIYLEGMPDAVFAYYLIRLKVTSRFISRFVYYFLQSPTYKEHIESIIGGSAQPNANAQQLTDISIPLFHHPEQRAITSILGSLDDKIELNQQMNKTLEAIGKAIFKHWFLDFEFPNEEGKPYKSSGGEMVESELGEIPRGWRTASIGESVRVVGGTTPSTKESEYWKNGTINWATPKDLSSLSCSVLLNTEHRITTQGLQQISSGLLPKGTVLLSSRAPIGYLAITEILLAINQGFIAMVCDRELPNHYVINWVRVNLELIKSFANGTTFLEINKTSFRPIKVAIPPRNVLQQYLVIIESFHEKVISNLRESIILTSFREYLLPKLMSGKIRVPVEVR